MLAWFPTAARDLPWRRTRDPYAIWISEIMLQQTQVSTVIPYWERWMSSFPDVHHLAAAPEARVLKLWEGLGYYSRARHLRHAAQLLLERHAGRFPANAQALQELPGIGPYTAGAIASIAFNQAAPILDGNVARVLARWFTLPGDPSQPAARRLLWELADRLVRLAARRPASPERERFGGNCSVLNQALMELGATICTPARPACERCPLRASCRARRTGTVADYPAPRRRPKSTRRALVTVVLEADGLYLVRQRPADAVNGGFWEFPNREIDPAGDPAPEAAAWLGLPLHQLGPSLPLRHAITRYRFLQHVFQVHGRPPRIPDQGQTCWVDRAALDTLHLTGPHRRLVRQLPAPDRPRRQPPRLPG